MLPRFLSFYLSSSKSPISRVGYSRPFGTIWNKRECTRQGKKEEKSSLVSHHGRELNPPSLSPESFTGPLRSATRKKLATFWSLPDPSFDLFLVGLVRFFEDAARRRNRLFRLQLVPDDLGENIRHGFRRFVTLGVTLSVARDVAARHQAV